MSDQGFRHCKHILGAGQAGRGWGVGKKGRRAEGG